MTFLKRIDGIISENSPPSELPSTTQPHPEEIQLARTRDYSAKPVPPFEQPTPTQPDPHKMTLLFREQIQKTKVTRLSYVAVIILFGNAFFPLGPLFRWIQFGACAALLIITYQQRRLFLDSEDDH